MNILKHETGVNKYKNFGCSCTLRVWREATRRESHVRQSKSKVQGNTTGVLFSPPLDMATPLIRTIVCHSNPSA